MYSILLKTGINRGNRDRKFDLCIKGCLASKKNSESYEIPREMNTVETTELKPASGIWPFSN